MATKSKYQRRHYEDVAQLLGEALRINPEPDRRNTVDGILADFIVLFRGDNFNFDAARFMDAVTKEAKNL